MTLSLCVCVCECVCILVVPFCVGHSHKESFTLRRKKSVAQLSLLHVEHRFSTVIQQASVPSAFFPAALLLFFFSSLFSSWSVLVGGGGLRTEVCSRNELGIVDAGVQREMFTKYLSQIKRLPSRSADWSGRVGPVALMGYDGGIPSSASSQLLHRFSQLPGDCDFYAKVTCHTSAPVECPPVKSFLLPVLNCGAMTPDEPQTPLSRDDWYLGMTEAATDLYEKGYIPFSAGGDGTATQAMVESYKRLFPSDEVVLLHFSAHPRLGGVSAPNRVLLEKDLLKGLIEVGNRCVTSDDRKVRKNYKTFYMDLHAIYAKGLFCIRDIRNDYPVFVSVDADVLDPAFAPGVPHPVPGGLSTRELVHIIHGIRGPKVIGVDLHGYDSNLDLVRGDGAGLTQITLSKVFLELVCKAYTVSTLTEEEGMARMQMMQREGTLSSNPYPDH